MKALILVGGLGTRLRPLTCSRPKQLLPLGSSTLIEYMVDRLKRSAIQEIILAAGYGLEMLRAALGDGGRLGVSLEYSPESKPLGTAGPIRHAERYLRGAGAFFVLNGDIVSDIDYKQLLQSHRSHRAAATIAVHRVTDPSRYGLVDLGSEGRIRAFIEKPVPGTTHGNLVNAGCYVLDESVLDFIPQGRTTSIERETFPKLCAERDVYAWEHKGFWIDTGTPESYLEANQFVLTTLSKKQGKVSPRTGRPVGEPHLTAPVLVGAGSQVDPSSKVGPNVTIGRNVTIQANARIRDAIIFDDAVIGTEVVIARSVVGQGATIGTGIHLKALALVGDGAIIDAESQIGPGARICPNCHIRPGATPVKVLC